MAEQFVSDNAAMRLGKHRGVGVRAFVLAASLLSATPAAAQWATDGAQWTDSKIGNPYAPSEIDAPDIIGYSEFLAQVDAGKVRSVTIRNADVAGEFKNNRTFRTTTPNDPGLIAHLLADHVEITVSPDDWLTPWNAMAIEVGALLLLLGLGFYLADRWQRSTGDHTDRPAINVGRTHARVSDQPVHRVTFADVAGIDEAQIELAEIVEFLKAPEKFHRLGGAIPKGCLLVGPPGNGKTLLARAVAGEAGVPFYAMPGSAFVEMYVGMGASRVRDLFDQARRTAPSIVFIDEIDALGHKRGMGFGAGNEERDQTLNQLLVEMDGFTGNGGIIVLAATNRPDVLDAALLRPGRFDRQVVVPNPDARGRELILDVHLRHVAVGADVERRVIARSTPGFSGADLANLVNEAALAAARREHAAVGMADFEAARDKILLGPERRSLAMGRQEREMAAYREAGQALVAVHTPGCDPVHKVTIVPRGTALGATVSLPDRDRLSYSRQQLEARIAMLLAGRVAEELVFGKDLVTTASADDIRRASDLARRMVGAFGFGARMGPVHYGPAEDGIAAFQTGTPRGCSQQTTACLDAEIQVIVKVGVGRACAILTAHLGQLTKIAEALLKHETLSGSDILRLIEIDALDVASRAPDLRPAAALTNC